MSEFAEKFITPLGSPLTADTPLGSPGLPLPQAGKSKTEIERQLAEEMIQSFSDEAPTNEPAMVVSVGTASLKPDASAAPDPYVANQSTEVTQPPNEPNLKTVANPTFGFGESNLVDTDRLSSGDYENEPSPARTVEDILASIPGYQEEQQPAERNERDRPRSQSLEQEIAARNIATPKPNNLMGLTPLAPDVRSSNFKSAKTVVENIVKPDPPATPVNIQQTPTSNAAPCPNAAPCSMEEAIPEERVFAPAINKLAPAIDSSPKQVEEIQPTEFEPLQNVPRSQFNTAPIEPQPKTNVQSESHVLNMATDPFSGEAVFHVREFSESIGTCVIPVAGAYREIDLNTNDLNTNQTTQPVETNPAINQTQTVLQVMPPAFQPTSIEQPVKLVPTQSQTHFQTAIDTPHTPATTQPAQMRQPEASPPSGNALNSTVQQPMQTPGFPMAGQLPIGQQPVAIEQPRQSSCRSNSTEIDDLELAAAFEACNGIEDPVLDVGVSKFSEETFDPPALARPPEEDEVFMAGEGDVINIDGNDGYQFIDLACFDIKYATIEDSKIIIDDLNNSIFEIHFKNVEYALFADDVKVDLD